MTGDTTGAEGTLLTRGQRINSALVVDRRLGEGAFAEVYRVRHHILGWQALKLFKHVASPAATSRMFDEARILSTLGHPNIIRVFGAGTVQTSEGVRGCITMEYVAGGSLERLAASHAGAVPVGEATAVLRQAAEGLAVAHERQHPIVHRDLSLANVLITYDESGLRVKVSDFGLAKVTDPGTMAASAQGTVAYMPPEVRGIDAAVHGDSVEVTFTDGLFFPRPTGSPRSAPTVLPSSAAASRDGGAVSRSSATPPPSPAPRPAAAPSSPSVERSSPRGS
jgi:serine/threonine protein kinase